MPLRRLPLFASFAGYRPAWLSADALAALTLAAIAVPEQIATARLIGMPPATGLLAFAAGTFAFAVFGAHRQLSVGANSTIAPVVAGALVGLAAGHGADYAAAAAMLALMVGGILVLTGIFRLGWIADLLSIPVTTGFLLGIAVHIVVSQLPALLGVPDPAGSLPARLGTILSGLGGANLAPLALGLGTLVCCLAAERIDQRIPGPMICLVGAGLLAYALDLPSHGLTMLDPLPPVAPTFNLHFPPWRDAADLLAVALIVALLCMMQTTTVLQAFAPDTGKPRTDPSHEFAAVGAGNLLAGLAGTFPVNASPPRTAIATAAGARSQLAGILAAALVLAAAALAGNALSFVPRAALAGILVFVAVRLVRIGTVRQIFAQSPHEAALVAVAAALVTLFPIAVGVGLAIGLSVLHSLAAIARPKCAELLRVPGTTVWWSVVPDMPAEREPGVLVFAFAAPLNFMNVEYLLGRLDATLAERHPRLVVLESSGVVGIDFTAARRLTETVGVLRGQGIAVSLARLESERAIAEADRTGVLRALGTENVFRSVEDAVRAWHARAFA